MQGYGQDDESAQGTDVERALATGSADQITRAVNHVLDRLRAGGDASEAIAAGDALQAARRFDALLKLADAGARVAGPDQSAELWLQAVTGLIELDASLTAERLVQSLLTEPALAAHRARLLARLGRIKKDQFVDTGDPAALAAAIRAYVDAYEAGADPLWVGVNAVALRDLAARRGLPPDGGAPIPVDHLFALATGAPMPRPAWFITTELELRLARGEPSAALQPLLVQLFDAPDASGFVYGSLARQLDEIWDVDPADPLQVMLGERTLIEGRGEVVLPSSAEGYERLFGGDYPIDIDTYRMGAQRACSVGLLLRPGQGPIGTVFALAGVELHPSLEGRTVLVTNEHVVPDPAIEPDKPRADELEAHFDGGIGTDGKRTELAFGGLRAVWRSPRTEFDITLLVTDEPAVEQLLGLVTTKELPPVRAGIFVYVIGHPDGGPLKLSIRGNDFIDEDGTKLHYKAPTARGSSGSPVFDDQWRLIGVHHKGSDELPALNGATGTYPGNEGIALEAIRAGIAQRPPEL